MKAPHAWALARPGRDHVRRLLGALLALAATASVCSAQTLPPACGTLVQSWGPFDYRPERYIPEPTYGSHKALLAIVESNHFTPDVESLRRGKTGALPGGDLSYTLAIFPNHHRALISLTNLAIRTKSPQPAETRYSVECYFLRGIAFRPDDHLVRMIYANYLLRIGKVDDAQAYLDAVAAMKPESPFTRRNLSLLYLEAKNYDKALSFAHQAAELGLNIDAVRQRLEAVGKWQEAQPAASPKAD